MSFPVIGSGFDATLITSDRFSSQSESDADAEKSFLGTLQNQMSANGTSANSGAAAAIQLPQFAKMRTQNELDADLSLIDNLQSGINQFDSKVQRNIIGDTTKLVPLQQENQAIKIPPIDQYESTRIFAQYVFDEQARIAREIDANNGKFTLRGEEYDISKTSGTMQLNFFLTEAQTALGAMQRMLSSYRDWEKRAVEFLQ